MSARCVENNRDSNLMALAPPRLLSSIEELNEDQLEEQPRPRSYIEFIGEPSSQCHFSNIIDVDGSILSSFSIIHDDIPFTIGRQASSWVITDPRVSKSHFKIYTIVYDKDKRDILPMLYCEDLESSNGTFVNGELIGNEHTANFSGKIPYLLTDGDVIEIKPRWKFKVHQKGYEASRGQLIKATDSQRMCDQYDISNRVLGAGNYGSVFLARELKSSRQVACKVIDVAKASQENLHQESLRSSSSRRRYLSELECEKRKVKKEIEILAALSHPHIINLRKAFYSNDTIYMFTDLATGGDLYSYLDSQNHAIPDENARVIALQIVHAIDYLHSMNIVHRDIKPENVLLSNADFGSRVVLTDFGFAQYVNNSTGRLMSRVGTHGFIAPEIDLQHKLAPNGYTKAADLWSFGMLVTFMLTGEQRLTDDVTLHLDFESAVSKFLDRLRSRSNVKPRAHDFIKNLLLTDAEQRMTSDQALTHAWFTEPVLAAMELRNGWERVNRTWKSRNTDEAVIEDLQPRRQSTMQRPRLAPKKKKALHDASSFPYTGLDRHLQPKKASKRKQLLEDLHGSSFMTDELTNDFQSIRFSNCKRKRSVPIQNVDGRDMFGQPNQLNPSQITTQDVSQDVGHVIGQSVITVSDHRLDESTGSLTKSNAQNTAISVEGPTRSQYFRTESVDQNLHDAAIDALPKWTNAKTLKAKKDEVAQKKFSGPKLMHIVP